MIAANRIQPDAEPAFAGHAGLRTGVTDVHQRGRCKEVLRLTYLPAVPSRNR